MLIRSLIYAYTSLNSAKVVHERLLQNVLRIPMSFFETTPTGRIINRFSKDQYVIDQGIPRTMSMFIVMLFSAITIFMVIGIVTPFFLTVVPPLGLRSSSSPFILHSSKTNIPKPPQHISTYQFSDSISDHQGSCNASNRSVDHPFSRNLMKP